MRKEETRMSENALPAREAVVKPPKKKIPALDLMKFMGILIVVFYHCRLVVGELYQVNILTDRSLDQYFFYGVLTLIGPCVPFFFLVNGYLLFDHKLDLKKHVKRTLHFVVLALFWSVVTLGLTVWESPWGEFSWGYTIKHGLLMDTNWLYHLWFMGAMVILYIFFPLMKSAWDHNRKGFYFFLAAATIIVFGNKALNMVYNVYAWLRYHVNYDPKINFFSMFNPFIGDSNTYWDGYGYIFVYFGLGAVIREHQEKFTEIMKPWICIVGIVVTTVILYLYGYFMTLSTGELWQSGDQCGNDIIFSLIRVLCIFGLAGHYKGEGKLGKFVTYIGANTMGIYLIHYVIRNLTVRYFRYYVHIPGYFLKTLVYSILVFFVSWVLMVIFKRIPVLKKLIA